MKGYHTLSNKINRQVYDLNMHNGAMNREGSHFDNDEFELRMTKGSQNYWNNRYYNYTRPADDLRNEEYSKFDRSGILYQLSENMGYKILAMVGIIVAVDLWQWRKG